MKVTEVIKRIEEDDWRQVRMKGSHRVYQHSTKLGNVIVAGNSGSDVPKGLLSAIWKQAGLPGRP
jgi:predicted RNA binding protein YcfA (HicA-like mRNA interferase family)